VAVLVTVLVSTLWAAGRAVGGSQAEPVRRHVVAEGETLWEIARDLVGPEGDPRPVIEAIRDANGMGKTLLVEGQTLVLPAA
jgi:LysM domain